MVSAAPNNSEGANTSDNKVAAAAAAAQQPTTQEEGGAGAARERQPLGGASEIAAPQIADNAAVPLEETKEKKKSKIKVSTTTTKKKEGKKTVTKLTAKTSTALDDKLDQVFCGFCNNPMVMTENVNIVEVQGKKIPKRAIDGKYAFESPGVAAGKASGVLCDTCCYFAESSTTQRPDGSSAIDIKQVVAMNPDDGTVRMVPVSALVSDE